MNEILRLYSKRIRIAAVENGLINMDTEDSTPRHQIRIYYSFVAKAELPSA